jgi:hypothetical protein
MRQLKILFQVESKIYNSGPTVVQNFAVLQRRLRIRLERKVFKLP